MSDTRIEERLARLERRTVWLRLLCGVQLLLFPTAWLWMGQFRTVEAQNTAQVLRVRGRVIEDQAGRARILMGAPFPSVPERVRQDSRTASILFLDSQGHDRLTLGEELEPQIEGKVPTGLHRIASGFGVVIHDGEGNERGAYGWLSNGRALITLDQPGAEAWAAVVNDKTGEAGMSFNFPAAIANDTSAMDIGTKGSEAFLRFRNKSGKERAVFRTENGGPPTFQVFDDNNHVTRQFLSASQ